MDTSDLVKRGARSLLVDLCKQIGEVVKAVPDLERFARDLVRESLGYKATGAAAHVNGTARARLATDLAASRKLRTKANGSGRRKSPVRTPWTAAQREAIRKRMKAYWAEAKRAGVDRKEQGAPSRAEIEAAKKAKAKTNNNHTAATAPASAEASAAE